MTIPAVYSVIINIKKQKSALKKSVFPPFLQQSSPSGFHVTQHLLFISFDGFFFFFVTTLCFFRPGSYFKVWRGTCLSAAWEVILRKTCTVKFGYFYALKRRILLFWKPKWTFMHRNGCIKREMCIKLLKIFFFYIFSIQITFI